MRRLPGGPVLFVAVVVAIVSALRLLYDSAFGAGPPANAGTGRGGLASAYGPGLYGDPLACGGRLEPPTLAVAHRRLQCGTRLRVCYGRRCLRLRVRDRGPYVDGRILDLTEAAAIRFGASSARQWGVRFVTYEPAGR